MSHPHSTGPVRLLPIASGHNLRDMGGYRAAQNRHTRWATLFRSGTTANLDEAGAEQIMSLGLTAVYDLRDNQERQRRPVHWCTAAGAAYYSRDYELSAADLSQLIRRGHFDLRTVKDVIQAAYRQMPWEQAEGYRELLRLLLDGRVPLLFSCTAGKDRTGLAAALILHALGVAKNVIAADYVLTDTSIHKLTAVLMQDARYDLLSTVDEALYLPLLRADPDYLDTAFQEIARVHGSIDGYLKEHLGVGQQETERLREVLLQ